MEKTQCQQLTKTSTLTMKCILNNEGSKCEEVKRTCEEMDTGHCSIFIPSDYKMKCDLNNEENKCKEVERTCEEMDTTLFCFYSI